MSKKVTPASECLITTSVEVEGFPSPIIDLFKSEEAPVAVAIGMARLESGQYVSYSLKFQGNKVISIVLEEPNNKLVALDSAKVAFVSTFTDSE